MIDDGIGKGIGNGIDPAAVAEAVGPGLAPDVHSGAATLEPVDVPGVGSTVVWRVRDEQLDHPQQAYVGRWPTGTVRLLSDDQQAWQDLMGAVGVRLTDPQIALGHVRGFLEVTRGPAVILYEVEDADRLRWRPGSPTEEANREAFLVGQEIEPPVAVETDDGFHVELTLVVDQRIQRNLFDVTPDGRIAASFRVLADNLPLPIAR